MLADDAIMHGIKEGPMAVSVDAGAWHDYESGVFDGGNQTNPALDHLVQVHYDMPSYHAAMPCPDLMF